MGNPFSPLGWVLIIFLILFILAINVGLFLSMKKKNTSNQGSWIDKIRNAGQRINDPFRDENQRIQELSKRVDRLKKVNPQKSGDTNVAGDKNE